MDRTRSRRWRVGAASALALAGLVVTVSGSPASVSRPRAPSSRCATRQLDVWLDTFASGAAGSRYYRLEFTNLGSTCVMRGFPGVSAVDLAGRRLGSPATRETVQPTRTVVLPARGTAMATLRIVDAANYETGGCLPTTAAGLRVFPPGQVRSRLVPYPFDACAGTRPRYLSVSAIRTSTPDPAGSVIAPRH